MMVLFEKNCNGFKIYFNYPMIFRVNMFIFHINLYFKHFINSMHNILEYFMYYISIKNYCQFIILTFIYLNISIVHFGSIFLSLVIKFLVVAFEEFVLYLREQRIRRVLTARTS